MSRLRPSRLIACCFGVALPWIAHAVEAVTSVAPSSVAAGSNQKTLWISGTGFVRGDRVAISGNGITDVAAPQVVLEADRPDHGVGNAIRYTVNIAPDATSGLRDITVTATDGTTATGVGLLEITGGAAPPTMPPTSPPTVAPAPDGGVAPPTEPPPPSGGVDVVTRASPTAGARGEQVNLWIVGRTFTDGVTVSFSAAGMGPALVDGLPLPLTVIRNAPSEVKLDGIQFFLRISPDTPTGPVDITVSGPDGTSAVGRSVFTVLEPGQMPPPVAGAGNVDTIAGASPPAFRAGRNVSLWIWGHDFEPGAEVVFSQPGIHPYSAYQVVNDAGNYDGEDGIRAFLLVNSDVPPGPVDVTVRNANGSQTQVQGLVQVLGPDGSGAGAGGQQTEVEPCLPDTTSIGDIVAVRPAEVLRDSPLPLTVVGHGFACGATVVISGGGLSAPQGSAPRIARDATDPTLTTLQWDLQVDPDARFGPRDVTVVNPNNTTRTLTEAFYVVETLSADGGVGQGSRGISACQARPGSGSVPGAAAMVLLVALGLRRRRSR